MPSRPSDLSPSEKSLAGHRQQHEELRDRLRDALERARSGGSARARERHRQSGKLLARERLRRL
ncbi:MAG: methylcrotonoyl-CoA carboxylase, partial [Planctomycetota bacterium]|nr:methylcrotonoyl-CoA carboxylase [Planctomycetota bacterium]